MRGGPKPSRLKTDQGIKFHVLLTSYELINIDKVIFFFGFFYSIFIEFVVMLRRILEFYFLADYNLYSKIAQEFYYLLRIVCCSGMFNSGVVMLTLIPSFRIAPFFSLYCHLLNGPD